MEHRFTVLADWQIRDFNTYRHRIWQPAHALGIARVPWLDALTKIYAFDGCIFWPSGRPFTVPEIDDVFPDPENRWMSEFLAADETGTSPIKHCRVIPRLRLIGLFCDIIAAEQKPATHSTIPDGARQTPGTVSAPSYYGARSDQS